MGQHRVKFGPGARAVARAHFPDGEASALADLTCDGRLICYSSLPRNERGSRIRIHGRTCLAEAGPDGRRLDTLFVFKLSSQPLAPPAGAIRHEATFQILNYEYAAEVDPVGWMFVAGPAADLPTRRAIEPSERLRQTLSRAGASLRSSLHPHRSAAAPTIDDLRRTWRRLVESVRRQPVPTREDQILRAAITPQNAGPETERQLHLYLETVFVSQVLEEQVDHSDRLSGLVDEFGRSEVPSDATRALLWAAASSELGVAELRDELIALAGPLSTLTEPDRERPWWDAICKQVYARRPTGESSPAASAIDDMLALLSQADDADEPNVTVLSSWAEQIRATKRSVSQAPAAPPAAPPLADVVPPPTVPRPGLAADDQGVIHEWVLRQRGLTVKELGEFRLEIERLRDEVLSVLTDLGGVVGLVRAPALGQSLRDSLDRNRLAFADDAALEWRQLLDASERAFANARERVGLDAVVSVIRKRPVSATDLDAAGQVFEARPFWKHLPPWWWHQLRRDVRGDDVNGDGETAVDDATLLEMFCVPRSRNLTQTACARLEALDEALRPAVSLLPPPPQGTTADDHLATEMARFGRELGHARQKYRESLTNLVDAGRLTHQEFLDFADQFDELERRVAPDAFGALTAEAAKFERSARLASFVRALERALDVTAGALAPVGASVEERMACTKDVGWKALRAKTEEYLQGAAADPAEPSADAIELHWADVGTPEDAKDKPPLFFHPHAGNDTSPFGFVRVPIVLLTGRPRRIDLEFAVRDDTDALRAGWPTSADWGSSRVQPTERSIHADEWHKDNREYQVTVPLTVPIRRPSSGQSLEFILTATDRTAVVSRGVARKPYVWDRLVVEADPNDGKPCVSMNWAAAEDPRSAEKVPVGPQIHLTEILERIAMGNSLAVTAPRRFGKSSLIALLEERLRGRKGSDTITVRVDCGAAVQPESTRLDHDKLWALVGKELLTFTVSEQDLALGVGLDGAFDGQTPPLPTPGDFDRVRRKAARLGKKRVVIFFDEAQRLFEAGPSYGARLRSLIATHLGKPTEGLATVVLCFVGLTSMTSARLGADLYPLLNPLTHAELREEQVAKVVRHVTEGSLYTTKLARERIAHSSWNLYALRTILLRLQRHVKDDYRMWATLEDVIAVEASLNSELRQGENPESIATYIRDALNAGATADDFQPVRAFPVAAAYAVALDDNRFGKDAVDATERTLNDWATQIFRDQLARPSYKRDAVEAHLAALDELRVLEYVKDALGGYRFRSEFLRSYLVGQIQHFLYGDDVFRDAMIRGGVRTIRLPADRKAIGRGVQAEVFRFSREQDRREQDLTARVRELRSSDEQLAFLDGLAVLEKIRSIHQGNRGGSEGIYKLRDVGLLEGESPTKAVEVYDYIPGADLEAKLGSLGAPIVVELGLRLARSLGVVHDQDVLHRDIRPKNIILQDHAPLPVLIDFGLACTRSVPGGTPLDDEFTAPEVKRQGAKWTAAADVFALAMTLRRLLPRGGQASDADRELDLALSQLCGPDLAARGHVDRLERILDNFAGRLEIKRREERLNDQLLDLAKNDGRQTELEWVIRQGCRMEINGFALGLYTAERERLRAIATFTNKLAEKAETSVGLWAKGKWSGKWPDGVSAIVDLRNEAAHGPRSAKNLSKEMVRAGVADVALWLKTGALIKIVDVLLRPERT